MIATLFLILAAVQPAPPPGEQVEVPEEIRRQLPPGATLHSLGPGRSDGLVIYDEPRIEPQRNAAGISPRPDAIVAEQRAMIAEARWVTLRPIAVGAPFSIRYETGSYFATVMADDGPARCLVGRPNVLFTPAHDEQGEIFPGACLLDRDGDGRFEAVRMMPYHPERVRPREMPIAPVALRPAPADAADARAPQHVALRRIRVGAVGEAGASLILEHGFGRRGQRDPRIMPNDGEDQALLPLRAGASVELGGVTVTIEGGPGAWRIGATGAFSAWISLDTDRVELRIDRYRWAPRRL